MKIVWKPYLTRMPINMRLLYEGYESKKKKYNPNKRVSVVKGNYVVVIELQKQGHATFITAYVADNSIEKIEQSPKWKSWKNKGR